MTILSKMVKSLARVEGRTFRYRVTGEMLSTMGESDRAEGTKFKDERVHPHPKPSPVHGGRDLRTVSCHSWARSREVHGPPSSTPRSPSA